MRSHRRNALDADLVDLESALGRTVRVGGLVVDLRSDGFTLDDGTATGPIVLTGDADSLVDLIEPCDAINVTGRVERRPDGELAVVVDDPTAVVLGKRPRRRGVERPVTEPVSAAVGDDG